MINHCKVMFCRFYGFGVRVYYRSSRSLGYGYGSVTELTEVPGGYKKCYPHSGYCGTGRTKLTELFGYGYECPTGLIEVPRTGMKVLQNLQKFRVLWHGRTELKEVPGRYKNAVPVSRVLWQGRTDLTEVPGTGMNVVQNSQNFFVRVWI